MNNVLTWVKQNIPIVVFGVVILAAAIGGPIVASKLNEGVEKRLSERARKFTELSSLEKTQVTNPATNEVISTVVNQQLLNRYREVVEQQTADAERVRRMALEHNRKDFALIVPPGWNPAEVYLFPEPVDRTVLNYWPAQYWDLLADTYKSMLDEVNAGVPPTPDDIADDISRANGQFRLTVLVKNLDDELSPDEAEKLRTHLQQVRLGRYNETARSVSFYGSGNQLSIPAFDEMKPPSLAEMFIWQWDCWITQDVLAAIAAANAESRNVLDAPVKRLRYLQVLDNPLQASEASSQGSGGPAGFGVSGGRGPKPPDAGEPPAMFADPKAPVPLDYNYSLTGRKTNALYDVRRVALGLIVDTERMPEVLDAIAKQNFFTVVDMDIEPANPFVDVREGYMYGPSPVMQVSLMIETVWLREWMTQYMPPDLKQTLGIPMPPPPGADVSMP